MLKVKKSSSILILLLVLVACGTNYGNKLESDEIDIFYTHRNNEEFARIIATYWKENDLLGAKKQFLQLDEQKGILILKIIPTEKFDPDTFAFSERAILIQLQDSLQPLVQPKRLEIVIAKNNFEPIFNIN